MVDLTGCVNDCVGRHVGYMESALGRQVGYLIHYNRNLQNLQTQLGKLNVAAITMHEKVDAAEAKGEKIYANVQEWLKNVAKITKEAEEIVKDKRQSTTEEANKPLKDEGQSTESSKDERQPKMKCVQGFCPNPMLRRRRSKKSLALVENVNKLIDEERQLSDISYVGQAKDVCLESAPDYQEFDSRASIVEKIMDELRSPNSDIILVHGIGGVGKTTLAEEVLRQVEKEKLFDDSIMVRDAKKPNLEEIQKVIADKLGLDVSTIQSKEGRADKICDRIKQKKTGESKQDKKTLVIIDDVWEEIDFKAVGLPHIPTCRILLTSRTSKLFSADKINQKLFPLGVLGEDETWLLFEKTTGKVVNDSSIRPIATQLAKKCGGLPALIVTVASSLRNEARLPIWRYALSSLERFDKEEELTEKAYSVLEWSYEQLHKNLKPLFLLCGAIVEGNSISLTNLFKYSMGLGFFKKTKNVKEARDALDTQVGKLKASNLLLDGDDDTCVRMHDLVHHVVNQIASRDHHVLVQDGADDELKEWPDKDLLRCMSKISLPCCNIATLPTVPWECPKLEMFHLNSKDDDSTTNMPSNFFKEMKNLKVLGLNNLPPISLPQSLQGLKNLQTLCLDGYMFEDIALVGELTSLQVLSIVKSKVKQLPKKIGQLTSLRLLDLSDCSLLKVISPGVISNLTSLEDLRMRNSFDKWEGEGVICETSNARLLELKDLSKLTAVEIRIPDANILPPDLFSDKLERYQIYVGDAWERDHMDETTLNTLKLQFTARNELDRALKMLLKKCDVLSLDGWMGFDFAYIINTKEVMFNLTTLNVYKCDSLKCLLSSSMARNLKKLKHLEISDCKIMEQIISTREQDEEDYIFGDLKSLKLKSLPNLARFCTGRCTEFPLLEELIIEGCTKLGAFVGGPMTKSTRKLETREKDSEENFDVHRDGTSRRYFLFDEKVRFPRLETLRLHGSNIGGIWLQQEDELQTIWHNQLVPYSFGRLREVDIKDCDNLKSIFPPSMMGRVNLLRASLHISSCDSLEAVFDRRELTNVKETHGTPTTQLKGNSVHIEGSSVNIEGCRSLKSIFPPSMMGRFNLLRSYLHISSCDSLEAVFDECGLTNVKETHDTSTAQLKDISIHIEGCCSLKSIFLLVMGRFNLLRSYLHISSCDSLEAIIDERGLTNVKETHGTSTTQLEEISVHIEDCRSLKSIFLHVMGKFNLLRSSLHISNCDSLEAVFDEHGLTNVKETHDTSITQLEEILVHVEDCRSLKSIFLLMTGRFNLLRFFLHISSCDSLQAIFDERGLTNDKKTHGTSTTQLEEISVHAEGCRSLKSIFLLVMGRFNLLRSSLHISSCDSLEAVFDERGLTNVKETHGMSTTQFEEILVQVDDCRSLKSIFLLVTGTFNLLRSSLHISSCDSLEAVFDERGLTNVKEIHGMSITQLEEISVHIEDCRSLKSIFLLVMGRFNLLRSSLNISSCDSLEVVFDERGLTNVKETHDMSTTQLEEISVHIEDCRSLKSIFLLVMGRFNLLQSFLNISSCDSLEAVFDERGLTNVKETHGMSITQLEEISVHVEGCCSLKSIFLLMMGRFNLLRSSLHISSCDSLEAVFDDRGLTNVKETHGMSTTQFEEILVQVDDCRSLKSIFLLVTGTFNLLRSSLHISSCDSLEAVFDERGLTNVKEIHGMSITQLEEISVHIEDCRSLKSIFLLVMGRFNLLRSSLNISSCDSLEVVFDERGLTNVKETHDMSTTQLEEISVRIEDCRSLKSIFLLVMGRFNLLRSFLYISNCDSLEAVFDERGLTNIKETHDMSTTQLEENSVHIEGCRNFKSMFLV